MNFQYTITKIDYGTWAIDEGMVRSYLLTGEDSALLLDTGNGSGDLKAAVDGLTALPLRLVNSHADPDHLGCNGQFGPAYLHPAEFALYEQKMPGLAHLPLLDGAVLDLGGRKLRVLLIPGHTPGSIALLDETRRMLFSGDSVSASPIFMFGDRRSLAAFLSSMERLEGSFDAVYPAHGPMPLEPSQIGRLKACCAACMEGRVEGKEPPFPVPAKVYELDGASFLLS